MNDAMATFDEGRSALYTKAGIYRSVWNSNQGHLARSACDCAEMAHTFVLIPGRRPRCYRNRHVASDGVLFQPHCLHELLILTLVGVESVNK